MGNADSGYLRQKQGDFAKAVYRMNQSRLAEASHPVLHEFRDVELRDGGSNPDRVRSAYSALIEMVGEPPKPTDAMEPHRGPKSRQFAAEYLDETQASTGSIAMRKRIIDGARRSLEKQYVLRARLDFSVLTWLDSTRTFSQQWLRTRAKQNKEVT